MKTTFISILFLMLSLVLKAQSDLGAKKPTYHPLQDNPTLILDSLKIPYLSIRDRNGGDDYVKIDVGEKKISEFKNFFSNDEFVFTPDLNTPSIELSTFFKDYKFSSEGDELYSQIIQAFQLAVIGFSNIALKNPKSKYRTIQIIEYRCSLNNTYGTIVLLGDEYNLMEVVKQ